MSTKAVVLLSGGLDSTIAGAISRNLGYELHALTFRYGQRHSIEVARAEDIAKWLGATVHLVRRIELFGGNALTDMVPVPKDQDNIGATVPSTYVPGRNLIFLAFACAYAASIESQDVVIGINSVDFSGYPDCRPRFLQTFQAAVEAGMTTSHRPPPTIHAPLLMMTKSQIIRLGVRFGVNFAQTHSCYDPVRDAACGRCDSCILRRRGFEEVGIADPTVYIKDSE